MIDEQRGSNLNAKRTFFSFYDHVERDLVGIYVDQQVERDKFKRGERLIRRRQFFEQIQKRTLTSMLKFKGVLKVHSIPSGCWMNMSLVPMNSAALQKNLAGIIT